MRLEMLQNASIRALTCLSSSPIHRSRVETLLLKADSLMIVSCEHKSGSGADILNLAAPVRGDHTAKTPHRAVPAHVRDDVPFVSKSGETSNIPE